MKVAEVRLWGRTIGAVAQPDDRDYATFEFTEAFARSGIEVAPLTMPSSAGRLHAFPELSRRTFHGLPGLLADALPDFFGNALIDAWLAREGRSRESFGAIERLCYVGSRAMGALEFRPSTGPRPTRDRALEVSALVQLAARILLERKGLSVTVDDGDETEALTQLLRVGTSAGGARAKALVAWNPETRELRSGQIDAGAGFEHWILKFDGVSSDRDEDLGGPLGYGAMEYAYALMAREAGLVMTECRLLEESGRRHFMTRRFDRTADGGRLHMLSLGGLLHLDYNLAGAHGYEQALDAIRRLGLSMDDVEQQFRRMVFNVVARNQDDHVKNIAFLMDRAGRWSLAPAFDVVYAYNPSGEWTSSHQMTVNGRREGITRDDLEAVARGASMMRGRAATIHEEVRAAVSRWPEFAEAAGVPEERAARIGGAHRLEMG